MNAAIATPPVVSRICALASRVDYLGSRSCLSVKGNGVCSVDFSKPEEELKRDCTRYRPVRGDSRPFAGNTQEAKAS